MEELNIKMVPETHSRKANEKEERGKSNKKHWLGIKPEMPSQALSFLRQSQPMSLWKEL